MGNRLSKLYTKAGDDGTTGLGDGTRVAKITDRIQAIGSVDELNSALGVLLSFEMPAAARDVLVNVQHALFDLGGELSIPTMQLIDAQRVSDLEQIIDAQNAPLPPLKEFILPGGRPPAPQCHVARAICRRAERDLWALAQGEEINTAAAHYLNRLSDLLFVLARHFARANGGEEVYWRKQSA